MDLRASEGAGTSSKGAAQGHKLAAVKSDLIFCLLLRFKILADLWYDNIRCALLGTMFNPLAIQKEIP